MIGSRGRIEAAYIDAGWRAEGIATLQVVCSNPIGGHALGMFLIDFWCAGLKDAHGRLDAMQSELDEYFDRAREDVDLVRIDPDLARKLVAGSNRFARQNGFRLPAHYDRWVSLLGDIGEIGTADLDGFGKDGKLFWVGPMDELKNRLIGCSVCDFTSCADVDFIAEIDDLEQFDLHGSQAREALLQTADTLAQLVAKTCAARGVTPPSSLADATRILISLNAATDCGESDDDDLGGEVAPTLKFAATQILGEVLGKKGAETSISQDLME